MKDREQAKGGIIKYVKNKYETPLQMLDRLRRERPELKDEKLSYLGRLDPLAHGAMLVAVGEANKEREKYLGLSKTYRVQFLCGVSTDTADVLGLIQDVRNTSEIDNREYVNAVGGLRGRHILPYPMYSSKTVVGKPLHEYARAGMSVEIPVRDMNVFSVDVGAVMSMKGEEIARTGMEATERVVGDFRQTDIFESWKQFAHEYSEISFPVITVDMYVSSGTYIRSLADELGRILAIPVLALDIERLSFTL